MSAPMPTAVVPPVTPPANQNWFTGLEPDLLGHAQNRGWDKLDPAAAATAALKAHREAESKLGIPADRILRKPVTGGPPEEAKAFWQQLGAPATPADYKFEGIDFGDPALNTSFTEMLRSTAAARDMPADMAQHFATEVFKYIENQGKQEEASSAAKMVEERTKLETDWGKPDSELFRANMSIADRTAQTLGVSQEALDSMKASMGSAEVAKFFRKLGDMTGEARYTVNPGDPAQRGGPMTREQAIARRFELTGINGNGQTEPGAKGDAAWKARLQAGGVAERTEWANLLRVIAGA